MEGFRAAFRRPALTFAEITWRWAVGATASVLFFFGLFEYLNTLPVTRGEMLFLRSRQPYLVLQAVLHILRGSLSRAVLSLLLAAVLLSVVWALAASLGRIATVREMLEYFRSRFASVLSGDRNFMHEVDATKAVATNAFSALLLLNILRVVVVIAAVLGLAGAVVVAKVVSPDAHPRAALAFFLFVPIAGLTCIFWSVLNWVLSLAAVFAVRDGDDTLAAIGSAVSFFRRRTGPVLAVSSWVALAHMVAFVAATTVVSMPLGFIPLVPWRLAVLAMILITLAYFAVADWLYMARLAGYVCIAEMPEAMFAPIPPPVPPTPVPVQTTIDRDELILSDLPNLATEM